MTREPHASSRRRRRKRATALDPKLDRGLPALLLLLLFGSVLAIGSVHVESLLVVSALALGAFAWSWKTERWVTIPASGLALALTFYSLLQTLPLPLSLLEKLSPVQAEVWERSLLPLGESAPSWVSLSTDPGATWVEALKWFVYAVVFSLAAQVGQQKGREFIARAVFGCATLVGGITLIHGLFGIESVFGLYDPSFGATRWAVSPLLNPNNLAGYLNLGLFTGVGLLATTQSSSQRWLYAFGIALLAGQSVLSASRGGVFSLLFGVLLVPIVLRSVRTTPSERGRGSSRKTSRFVLGTLGFGLLLGLFGAQQATWQGLQEEGLEKLYILQWAAPLLLAHPWFGVGAGAFETAFPAYRKLGESSSHVIWTHPENFLVGWIADFGFPLALFALAFFLWQFRPRALGAHEHRLPACALLGVLLLCAQNFVDLAFAVPGVLVALSCLLGGLWGANHTALFRERAQPPLAPKIITGVLPLTAGVLCFCLVLFIGRHTAAQDRHELSDLKKSSTFGPESDPKPFLDALEPAIRRHPGDAYLPLLGAEVAWQSGQDPLPWLARSLERDLLNGRTHLFLADVLQTRGARAQALFELRMAAEREPGLALRIAERAILWSTSPTELERVLPEQRPPPAWDRDAPSPRARLLHALGQSLTSTEQDSQRERFLKEALALEPGSAALRKTLIRDALTSIKARAPRCKGQPDVCQQEAERHLTALSQIEPDGSDALLLRARLLDTLTRPEEARALLEEQCPRSNLPCLRGWLELSSQHGAELEIPAQTYLTLACSKPNQCGLAHQWVAHLYARRKQWGSALSHFTQAADRLGTAEAWLQVAQAAQQLGAKKQVLDALERARRFAPRDPIVSKRIEDLKRSLYIERTP